MATEIGRLDGTDGSCLIVSADGEFTRIWLFEEGGKPAGSIRLREDWRDGLRELLDRAAMPGQPQYLRACCDHCDNRDDHDYTENGPHGGPCPWCTSDVEDDDDGE